MTTLLALNAPSQVSANIFCFHWVAGNGNAFKTLARAVEKNGIKVYGVTLPGRNGRNIDQIPSRMSQVTHILYDLFLANHQSWKLNEAPLVFLGHSLGGIVAFELAKKLKYSCNAFALDKLIISAVKDPELLSADNSDSDCIERHNQESSELKDYIIKIGGLPAGVDPAFLDFALPTIRADYRLFETYDSNDLIHNESKKLFGDILSCSLTSIVALQDYSVKESMMDNWKHMTVGTTKTVYCTGSHFYLIEEGHKLGFEKVVREEVLSVVGEGVRK